METDISFYLMMSDSSISRKTTKRKQTFLFSQTRPCSLFFVNDLLAQKNSFKTITRQKRLPLEEHVFHSFILIRMTWSAKKCCCFLCECVLHVLCLIQMALIYLFLVLFVFYSSEYTEYKKKRQKERKKSVFEKKEASVFYLFSFILACNLEKKETKQK